MNQRVWELAREWRAWLIASGLLLFLLRWVWRVFMRLTDITFSYNWSFDGSLESPRNFRPNLDIRNSSQSRTYRIANVKYTLRSQLAFDNDSIWGRELKPGSIEFASAKPVPLLTSLIDATATRVAIRLQDGREIVGQGPGQELSRVRRLARSLRSRFDKASLSVE
jgi:hypothetical protein